MKTTMIVIGYQLERIPMICLAFLTQHWSVRLHDSITDRLWRPQHIPELEELFCDELW